MDFKLTSALFWDVHLYEFKETCMNLIVKKKKSSSITWVINKVPKGYGKKLPCFHLLSWMKEGNWKKIISQDLKPNCLNKKVKVNIKKSKHSTLPHTFYLENHNSLIKLYYIILFFPHISFWWCHNSYNQSTSEKLRSHLH